MPEERIVLILGAGSNVDYHFPTSRELVRLIVADFQISFSRILPGNEVDAFNQKAEPFVNALRKSGSDSIDEFLQPKDNEPFWPIGKVAIANALLPLEREGQLFPADPANDIPDDWYRFLFRILRGHGESIEEFPAYPIGVITYNYDRSLEFYLQTALENRYHVSPERAWERVAKIPPVHVHGQLGYLSRPEKPNVQYNLPYNTKQTPELCEIVREAAGCIRIVHDEAVETSPQLQRARDILRTVSVALFMGFGYDRANLERLQLKDTLSANARIEGTGHEFSQPRRSMVMRMVTELWGKTGSNRLLDTIDLKDCRCEEFIRRFINDREERRN